MNDKIEIGDRIDQAGDALSKADYVLQDITSDYFGKIPGKAEAIALMWDYERTQTKANIVSDYLFEVRNLLKEAAEFLGGDDEEDPI